MYLGVLLVAVGVSLSGTVLEWAIFPSGTIVGTARRGAVLGVARIALVVAGAYLLVRRPRITVVDLSAFAVEVSLRGSSPPWPCWSVTLPLRS